MRYLFGCLIAVFVAGCGTADAGEPSILQEVECVRESEGLPPDTWESSITSYEASDSANPPDPGSIVFVGSSSILYWESLDEDMAPMSVLNRGFGGSTIPHVTYFAERIVLPYEPSAIVLYAGDNDIGFGSSADCTFVDFKAFVAQIRAVASDTPIYFISIKPSPARWELWEDMRQANRFIEALTTSDSTLHYIDVSEAMLDEQGEPIAELYLDDHLHMAPAGYALWTSIVRPRLAADLGL